MFFLQACTFLTLMTNRSQLGDGHFYQSEGRSRRERTRPSCRSFCAAGGVTSLSYPKNLTTRSPPLPDPFLSPSLFLRVEKKEEENELVDVPPVLENYSYGGSAVSAPPAFYF